jgi:hypothetical protein
MSMVIDDKEALLRIKQNGTNKQLGDKYHGNKT